jgi:hypothetical protein
VSGSVCFALLPKNRHHPASTRNTDLNLSSNTKPGIFDNPPQKIEFPEKRVSAWNKRKTHASDRP